MESSLDHFGRSFHVDLCDVGIVYIPKLASCRVGQQRFTAHGRHTKFLRWLCLLDCSYWNHLSLQRLDVADHLLNIHLDVKRPAAMPRSIRGAAGRCKSRVLGTVESRHGQIPKVETA